MKFTLAYEGSAEDLAALARLMLREGQVPHPPTATPRTAPTRMKLSSPPTEVHEPELDVPLGGPSDWKGHRGPSGAESTFHLPGGGTATLPAPGSRAEGPEGIDLASIQFSQERYTEVWQRFCEIVKEWIAGWKEEDTEQPDREALIKEMGSGRLAAPILKLAYDYGGLQMLVERALVQVGYFGDRSQAAYKDERFAFLTEVAGSMVQIGIAGFPDLTYVWDHTDRWKREE